MNEKQKKIIEQNKKLGLQTKFILDNNILGYCLGNTVYLNENLDSNLEKVNLHEVLHFYVDFKEFQEIKEYLFEKYQDKIDEYRDQYYLRYFGLYSQEEIKAGILDEEIAIDFMIDNFPIQIENGLKVGDVFFDSLTKSLERKRYLNLNIKNNIAHMNLSTWEKIFVINFYNGESHKLPIGEHKYEQIRDDIKRELNRLYSLDKEEFEIYYNSPEVIHEYESELKAMETRGEDTSYFKENKDFALKEIAKNFSDHLYEEYYHIVNFLKGNNNYEDVFKVVLLRETLQKSYKKDTTKEKTNIIIKKRDLHRSITGHMTLASDDILKILYKNINDYNNFANLYFAALEVYNKSTIEKSEVQFENVETFEKGKWIQFEGKTSNEQTYLENSKKLESLVQNTPWCTKSLASTQLADGDFYVFVDLENQPHIAVKMKGNEIDEVRGILNGNAQELEEDYRDVALSFLENNQNIKNGKEWFLKEEMNKRLIQYNKMIEEGNLPQEFIPNLIEDYFKTDYKSHGGENTNKQKLLANLPKILNQLAIHFNCLPEEICLGDYDKKVIEQDGVKTCPYKVIFGCANFSDSKITSLGNLQYIGGDADFGRSNVTSLGTLQSIGGDAYFGCSNVTSLGNLTTIEGNAYFYDSKVTSLGNLQYIGGDAYFCDSNVTSLGNLTTIGGLANFSRSNVTSLGTLQYIGGDAYFYNSEIIDLGNLTTIGGIVLFNTNEQRKIYEREFQNGKRVQIVNKNR